MSKENKYLSDISEIKSMMERSSRFISLSGLSGVFAGIYALIGAAVVYHRMYSLGGRFYTRIYTNATSSDINFMIATGVTVLTFAVITGILFTTRKAKKQQLKTWSVSTRKLLINLTVPLIVGGLVCLKLWAMGSFALVAPLTLIFYGIALVNASHFTFRDIRYLGLIEMALGLIALLFIGYGLLFWAVGFGVLHIIYGTSMYYKYER